MALLGLAGTAPGRLTISAIEHPSVVGPAEYLASRGWVVERLGVDGDGVAIVDELVGRLSERCPPAEPGAKSDLSRAPVQKLAAVMLGNNETGVLQPVAELAGVCRVNGVLLHTDAVQVVGKLPVSFQRLSTATLSFSAHKFHGPRGIGGLLIRGDVELSPLLFGGFQQGGMRPGTEPVALIAGMHKALEIWRRDFDERVRRVTALRDRFESALQSQLPGAEINGAGVPRLPHTSNVSFRGLDRRALAMALDLEGVACSTGSACASGSSEPSPVLLAMGLPSDVVAGSLRFSLGATTTEAEIDEAVARIARVVERSAAGIGRKANLR
jgi:cysteine desulfurase